MSGRYDDIIHLEHHISQNRKRMPILDRAAQFSPFAALTGYDAVIRETGRQTDWQVDLDKDGLELLNERIALLAARQEDEPEVTVVYFVPDERKCGGAYESLTDRVKRVDVHEKAMIMSCGKVVYFSSIREIRGDIFE